MTCPDADTLAALDTLAEDRRAAIVDHAASCRECRPLVIAMVGIQETQANAWAATLASTDPVVGAAPAVTQMIDRYRVERRLGEGAMGVVFAAYDPELARRVAVKVLRVGGSPERMRREAQALAKLTHPNVVAVYDVGEHDGATFVTMALVDGENLRSWLGGEHTTEAIIDTIVQATRGVDAAHRAGIIHRDIKPDNIFVARTGEVLVGDFGLARSGAESTPPVAPITESAELTRTGTIVGTPAYMAPEQIDGEVQEASDQFALCVTAWEALYGTRPFKGSSIGELATAMHAGPPPNPRTRAVPVHVRAAIRRGLSANPSQRFPSMAALLAALTPRKRRRWPYVAIALAAAGGATAAVALRGDPLADAIEHCETQGAPGAWNGARRARALADFEKQGMSAPVRAIAAKMLDRYATEWTGLARSSCIANAKREVSDPVHATVSRCLQRRAAVLAWTLDEPTLEPMMRVAVIEGLEPIEVCRTTEARPEPPRTLAALQHEIDRAAAQSFVGNVDLVDIPALHARIAEVDDPGVAAEGSYLEALLLYRAGRDPEKQLRVAITKAEVARDDRIRTRASALFAVVMAKQTRPTDAAAQRDFAVSALARSPDALTKIAVERANVAVAYAQADTAAELAALQRIEQLELERIGDPSTALANAQFAVAGFMQRTNHPRGAEMIERAFATFRQFADIAKDTSPDASLLALAQADLGEKTPMGRIAIGERMVAIARASVPKQLPMILGNLGVDYMFAGDYERAMQYARESAALIERQPDTATEEFRLGMIETFADSAYAAAEQTDDKTRRGSLLDEVHAALARLPATRREVDYNLALRGRTLVLQNKFADAVAPLTTALAAAERDAVQNPYRIVTRSFALAEALWESGGPRDRDRARALAEQAASRVADAHAFFAQHEDNYASGIDRLERLATQIEAWRHAHP